MSKIKYLVAGVDNEELGKLIGNLVFGETQSDAEVIVSQQPVPRVFNLLPSGAAKEVSFAEFLTVTIQAERKKIADRSSGEGLIKNIVELKGKARPEIA